MQKTPQYDPPKDLPSKAAAFAHLLNWYSTHFPEDFLYLPTLLWMSEGRVGREPRIDSPKVRILKARRSAIQKVLLKKYGQYIISDPVVKGWRATKNQGEVVTEVLSKKVARANQAVEGVERVVATIDMKDASVKALPADQKKWVSEIKELTKGSQLALPPIPVVEDI